MKSLLLIVTITLCVAPAASHASLRLERSAEWSLCDDFRRQYLLLRTEYDRFNDNFDNINDISFRYEVSFGALGLVIDRVWTMKAAAQTNLPPADEKVLAQAQILRLNPKLGKYSDANQAEIKTTLADLMGAMERFTPMLEKYHRCPPTHSPPATPEEPVPVEPNLEPNAEPIPMDEIPATISA